MKADYIHKDSLTLGELDGVKVMLSPEAYEEVKKQKIIEENKILKEQQQELERYKNIVDKIKILSNQVKEEAKEVENEWCYQVMKEIDYLIELKGSDN